MLFQGLQKVRSKGGVYYYAWRGGPRLSLAPEDPGFEREYERACAEARRQPGKRKVVLKAADRKVSIKDAALKAIDNARQRARRRGIEFALDTEDIMARLERTGGCCELSGIEFSPSYGDSGRYAFNPYGVSLDRIDATVGYTPSNVRVVLTAVNFAIHQWGLDAYLKIASAITQRHKS